MILEEKYVFPRLDLPTREQLKEDHRRYKLLLSRGQNLSIGDIVEHTAMEVETFPR
jgi:hypothetical protein